MPAELTLDHRFPGMVSVFVEPAAGVDAAQLASWYRSEYLPSVVPGTPLASVLGFSPLPLLADAPGDVPRSPTAAERMLLLFFIDEPPEGSWADAFAGQGKAVGEAGLGRVVWAAPFIGTVPGTDTYTDQLWEPTEAPAAP